MKDKRELSNGDKLRAFKKEVRKAVADYMRSEGCSCCRDIDAHKEHEKVLAKLLNVPMYDDESGFNFTKFHSNPPLLNQ